MPRRPRSRWFVAAVGCFSLVLITVGSVGAALLWAGYTYRSLGEPVATAAGDADVAALQTATLSPQEFPGASRGRAVKLLVRLSEGNFEVLPGPPGSDITVDGTFADNYYDLVEDRRDGPDGGEVEIRLEPSAGWFTRIMAGLNNVDSKHPNKLRVLIPPDMAVNLTLRIDSGQSEVELGGLNLTGLDADLSKGSFSLDIEQPLTGDMDHASLRMGMGDGRASGLGNARVGTLLLETGMGSFRVDLDGAWRPAMASVLEVSHQMGDLTLSVPRTIRIDPDSSSTVMMGGVNGRLRSAEADEALDPEAPILRVEASASMGGVNFRRR